MTRRILVAAMAVLAPLAAAHAASLLTITKSSVVVADAVSAINPKALPGATIDYSLLASNPNGLLSGATFTGVTITDAIPAKVILGTANYPGATAPIEFTDGGLLGTGLINSGVSLTYKGLADDTDGIDFYDSTGALVHPTGGYDARVRSIKVTLTGTQAVLSAFRLRFRVQVK